MKKFDIVFVSNESEQEAVASKRYAVFYNKNECFYCNGLKTIKDVTIFRDAIMFRNAVDVTDYCVRPYLFIVPVFEEEEFEFGEKVMASNNFMGFGKFYYVAKTDNGKFIVSVKNPVSETILTDVRIYANCINLVQKISKADAIKLLRENNIIEGGCIIED